MPKAYPKAHRLWISAAARNNRTIMLAAALLGEKGCHGTHPCNNAVNAGVSEVLIIKHFSSKEELTASILVLLENHPFLCCAGCKEDVAGSRMTMSPDSTFMTHRYGYPLQSHRRWLGFTARIQVSDP